MISPCLECSHRTVTPNCHADCEEYLLFTKYRQKIRDARYREQQAVSAIVDGARKIKINAFRHRKK